MSAVGDMKDRLVDELGPAIVASCGEFGPAGEDVELGDGGGGGLEAGDVRRDVVAEAAEEVVFEFVGARSGGEDVSLVFLEFVGNVAFGVLDGLAADVVGRDAVAVGVGDFDVEAEDPVEADLEVGDAGALLLAFLVFGDPSLSGVGDVPEPVEFGVDAIGDDAALALGDGGVGSKGRSEAKGEIIEAVESQGEVIEKGFACVAEQRAERREAGQAVAQGAKLARVGAVDGDASDAPFDVADLGEMFAERGAARGVVAECGDDGLSAADRGEIAEREAEPLAEEPRAHGVAGVIDGGEK